MENGPSLTMAKQLPSLLHALLVMLFGPIAGVILRHHYNTQDDRETGSFFWYLS